MIKKIVSYLIIGIFITSCVTPKAVDIMQANDEVMTCNELRFAFEKADLNEDEEKYLEMRRKLLVNFQ